jgi:hypothetical protein
MPVHRGQRADYDLRTAAVDPPSPVWDGFERVVYGVFAHHGRPLDAGMRLARWFAASGVGAPTGMTVGGFVAPMAVVRPMMEAVYLSTLPLALAAGLTTEADDQRWRAELAAAPPALTVRWPLLHGAYTRKPSP